MSQQRRVSVLCPHCGAPLPARAADAAATCAFCGVSSAPVREPPPSAPQPTAVVLRFTNEIPEAPTHGCPVCGLPLFTAETEGVTLRGCGRCGGIWVDNASARHALTVDADPIDALQLRAAKQGVRVPKPLLLRCPDCGAALRRADVAGVEVDVCETHGTWFDPFELGLVLQLRGKKPVVAPTTYGGAIPDFRAGASSPSVEALPIVAGAAVAFGAALLAAVPDPTE